MHKQSSTSKKDLIRGIKYASVPSIIAWLVMAALAVMFFTGCVPMETTPQTAQDAPQSIANIFLVQTPTPASKVVITPSEAMTPEPQPTITHQLIETTNRMPNEINYADNLHVAKTELKDGSNNDGVMWRTLILIDGVWVQTYDEAVPHPIDYYRDYVELRSSVCVDGVLYGQANYKDWKLGHDFLCGGMD